MQSKWVLSILILNAVLIILAFFGNPPHNFSEQGFITSFSVFQLLISSLLCGIIFWNRKNNKNSMIWLIIALGFLFLALDEKMEIHERADKKIHALLGMEETPLTDRIDDLFILLYGVIGIAVLYFYREELHHFSSLKPFFIIGFIFLGITIFLDVLTNGNFLAPSLGLILGFGEEIAKLLGEAFFLIAFAQGAFKIH